MIDTDLYDIEILSSQDLNMVELSNFKKIKSQNTYLKYGLIISGFIFVGFLAYSIRERNDKEA